MRDEYDDPYRVEEATPPPGPAERALGLGSTVIGAVLCVAIVIGVAYWFADLGEREAASLPVFRASLEPAKVRPDDPGGAETPYQDIRSYEVAIDGGADESGETGLTPPPAQPTEEDVPMAELAPQPEETDTGAGEATAGAVVTVEPEAGEIAGETQPPAETAAAESPAEETQRSQQAVDEAARLAARAALSPIQIQLGAFTDRDFTESEWHRIARTNADILGDRALAIQPTESGGKKYYRLRVGPFRDRAEAAGVCEALQARGQDCLVATNG